MKRAVLRRCIVAVIFGGAPIGCLDVAVPVVGRVSSRMRRIFSGLRMSASLSSTVGGNARFRPRLKREAS